MYTQCPECHARFRVGAGDLSAASGTVRCGRCGSAFNALDLLSDTVPSSLDDATSGPGPGEAVDLAASPEPVSGVGFHFTADDIESVFVEARNWPGRPGPFGQDTGAADPHAFAAEAPAVVLSENQSFEDITLEGERISIESILGIATDEDDATHVESPTDEFEVLREVADSAFPDEDDSQEVAAAEVPWYGPAGPIAPSDDEASPAPAAELASALASEPSLAAALEPGPTRLRPSRSSLAWSFGCLVLVLALLAQITHQYRQDLVRHSQVGPLLRDIYGRIGMPLSPNWDLDAFELRQWGSGGGPDTNGRLTVRASLTNRAAFALPHPILRLEFDDRFGDSIAVRDFDPAEYVKNAAEASRLLGPGASAEAELVVIDPGQDAVGYQLDVCLRESAAVLRCAQGPG
jgi:predicted Zn finger-like uncharacterized protein